MAYLWASMGPHNINKIYDQIHVNLENWTEDILVHKF